MRRPVLIRQPRHSSPRSGQWSSSQFGGRHLGSDESILQLRFWVSSGSLTPPQPIPACRLRMLSLVVFLTACLPLEVGQIRCERRRERRHQSDEADEEGRRHQGETQGSASASLRTPTRVSSERLASLAKEGSFRSTRLHSLPFHPHIR